MSDEFDHGFREGVTVGALMATITIGVLLGLAFLLSGCGAADDCPPMADAQAAYDLTAANWEAEIGELPADYAVIEVETREVPAISDRCPVPPEGSYIAGCSWYEPLRSTYVVEVLECQPDSAETQGHEYAHILLHLVTGDGDAGHERTDVWGPVAAPREVD